MLIIASDFQADSWMTEANVPQTQDWREARRRRAWELHQQGWSQRQIADEVGVTQGAVSQWLKGVRERGVDALKRRPAPGKRAVLTAQQLTQLPGLLEHGAEAYGFADSKWTTERVAAVLEQVFDVVYHPAHVSRLLRKHYPDWRQQRKG